MLPLLAENRPNFAFISWLGEKRRIKIESVQAMRIL